MFVDQQNRYTSLDKCLKIDFFKKNFKNFSFWQGLKVNIFEKFEIVCNCV